MHARTRMNGRAKTRAACFLRVRARVRANLPSLHFFSERPGTFFSQLVVYKARDGRRVRPLHRPAERFCARRAVCGGTDPVARAHDLGQYASIRSVTVVP